MGKELTREFAFRSGAVRLRDLGYVVASLKKLDSDEVGNSAIFSWDRGTWGAFAPLQWSSASSCVAQFPKEQFVVVGGDDSFAIAGQGDFFDGHLWTSKSARPGIVRAVASIAGWAYAVGFGGMVVKRTEIADWTAIHQGLPTAARLEAIHGFNESDMYAAGWTGQVWNFDGSRWSKCTVPSASTFSCVCCAGDGNVYLASSDGTLLRGRENTWQAIANAAPIWDLEWFNDKVYAATTEGILEVESDRTWLVRSGGLRARSAHHLSAADGVMWSVGERDVVAFDGKKWRALSTVA